MKENRTTDRRQAQMDLCGFIQRMWGSRPHFKEGRVFTPPPWGLDFGVGCVLYPPPGAEGPRGPRVVIFKGQLLGSAGAVTKTGGRGARKKAQKFSGDFLHISGQFLWNPESLTTPPPRRAAYMAGGGI